MTYRLPAPYAGAATEPPEPRTIGRCAQCGDGFGEDETVFILHCADGAIVHQGCALDLLMDTGGLSADPARSVFDMALYGEGL